MFWIYLALQVIGYILFRVSISNDSAEVLALVYIVFFVGCVIQIISWYKLSKAFGHGAGFTFGLLFLNLIFILILAFGSSQYVGNTTVTAEKIEE